MKKRSIVALLVSLVICGCSLAPDFERPRVDVPANYSISNAPGSVADLAWFDLFQDETLKELIRTALANNKDLALAAGRIEEARGLLGFTRADQFPQIGVSGNAERIGLSEKAYPFDGRTYNDFGLFGDLSWELDLWGRLRNATAAQRAELLAVEENYRALTISLISQVAITYFVILDLTDQLGIAHETVKSRGDSTSLINARFSKGIVPELDLNQAQIEETDAIVTSTSIERNLRQSQNAMAVLLGQSSYSIQIGKALSDQKLPENLPTGLPAELIERRPDIRAAEAFAQAEVARIGVARAEQLPTFDLLGAIGLESEKTNHLFNHDALTWNIGTAFAGPLIDFGKTSSGVDISEARAKQAMSNYEQSVLRAIQEVEDALIAVRTYSIEIQQLELQVRAARNADKLSHARYDEGVTSYLEVLDIERSLFNSELTTAQTRRLYLSAIVQLYKALGGGWINTADTAGLLYVEVR